MEYMGAGRCPVPYLDQLDELAALKVKHPETVLPFICIDPRRQEKQIAKFAEEYIEKKSFTGIKIYPSLGFYPFDKRLFEVYEYCQSKAIPIIFHCSPIGLHFKYPITQEMLTHPVTGEKLKKTKNSQFAKVYSHPRNYKFLMDQFPQLKICLAHFGGDVEWKRFLATQWDPEQQDSWFSIILNELIRNPDYPNVYADVAYTLTDNILGYLLKSLLQDDAIREYILLGTDFFVSEIDITERVQSINIRGFLEHRDYKQIAEINPMTFLSNDVDANVEEKKSSSLILCENELI